MEIGYGNNFKLTKIQYSQFNAKNVKSWITRHMKRLESGALLKIPGHLLIL
jgi:hypothetical protein